MTAGLSTAESRTGEFALLGLLALLWGSSYLFIKVAVAEIPPLTLIAARASVACVFLFALMRARRIAPPRGAPLWGRLYLQAVLNAIAAWTILAWGQQYVDAGLASVLNSTSPLFVFFFTLALTRHEPTGAVRLFGACLGVAGVTLIVGVEALEGLGREVAGQLAALFSAALYACAAIHGRRFSGLSPAAVAMATMLCAAATLIPMSLAFEAPWRLAPSHAALGAAFALGLFCTAIPLVIYFRLVRTLGSLGVASQAYLRAGIGVALGVVVLGETVPPTIAAGLAAALLGVALINWRRG